MMCPKVFYSIATKLGGNGLSLVAQMACEASTKRNILEQIV